MKHLVAAARERLDLRRKRRALRRLRDYSALLALPLDRLADDQVQAGVIRLGRVAKYRSQQIRIGNPTPRLPGEPRPRPGTSPSPWPPTSRSS